MSNEPLLVLLDHCQQQMAAFAVQAEKAERRARNCQACRDPRRFRYWHIAENKRRISCKWQGFAEAVGRAMAAGEEINGLKDALGASERERERLYQQLTRMGAPVITLVQKHDPDAGRRGA